jgi:hypothetical protein
MKQTLISSLAFAIVGTLLQLGCASPEAVASFAQTSLQAVASGPSIFHDLHDSCARRHENEQPITSRFIPSDSGPPREAADDCAVFAKEGDALVGVSDVLAAYLRAMEQLASFDTSTVSGPGEAAAENAATAANLDSTRAESIGKLASLITQAFTDRYQRSRLTKYVQEADPRVASITQAFEDIVSKDYQGMLRTERRAVARRYQDVGDPSNTAVILLLNRAYGEDISELDKRKAEADAYVAALQQIREGHHALAQNVNHMDAKQLGSALQPYTGKLDGLLPALRKGT